MVDSLLGLNCLSLIAICFGIVLVARTVSTLRKGCLPVGRRSSRYLTGKPVVIFGAIYLICGVAITISSVMTLVLQQSDALGCGIVAAIIIAFAINIGFVVS